MIHEFNKPIPVVLESGEDGYAIYVNDGGQWDNDIWCVCLCNGGLVRHYLTNQIRIHANETYDIKKLPEMNPGVKKEKNNESY